jgi:hypothetical protein
MKVFISWSGDRSKHVAIAFRTWLRRISPSLQPWVSSVDIQKGFSWDSSIAKELNESRVGLICLTEDNLKSPYLHYEVGAISNVVGSNVYTFLFGIEEADVHQPLSRFQNTKFEKEDIRLLVRHINLKLLDTNEAAWTDDALEANFDLLYPSLEAELNKAPLPSQPIPQRTTEDLLEEVLKTVRGIKSEPNELLPEFIKRKLPFSKIYTSVVNNLKVTGWTRDVAMNRLSYFAAQVHRDFPDSVLNLSLVGRAVITYFDDGKTNTLIDKESD